MAADLTQRALLLVHPGAWSESVWSIAVEAQLIGTVHEKHPGLVTARTPFGTTRIVDMLAGDQLPRIC